MMACLDLLCTEMNNEQPTDHLGLLFSLFSKVEAHHYISPLKANGTLARSHRLLRIQQATNGARNLPRHVQADERKIFRKDRNIMERPCTSSMFFL